MSCFNRTNSYKYDITEQKFQSLFQSSEVRIEDSWTFLVSSRNQDTINLFLHSNRPGLMPNFIITNDREEKKLLLNIRINISVYILFLILPLLGTVYLLYSGYPNNNIYLGILIYSFLGLALNCWIVFSSFSDLNKIIETELNPNT